jgi:transcription elongation factor/antiterminator RfaH
MNSESNLNSESNFKAPRWYVVHTNSKQEDRAAKNLRAWQVETFSPRMKERSYNQFTNEPILVTRPLFPRYIFARFAFEELLHKVSYTRGVHSVVNFNGAPAPVDDEIIAFMQAQVDTDGYVKIGGELKAGDMVRIDRGPFRDLIGIFDREMKEADRVMILLTSFTYQTRMVIDRGLLKKVATTSH